MLFELNKVISVRRKVKQRAPESGRVNFESAGPQIQSLASKDHIFAIHC